MAEKFLGNNKLDKQPEGYFEHLVRFADAVYHDGRVYYRSAVNFKGAPAAGTVDKVLVLNPDGDITYVPSDYYSTSGSAATLDTGSLVNSGSFSSIDNILTLYRADGNLSIDLSSLSDSTAVFVSSSTFNHYTSSANIRLDSLEAATSSYLTSEADTLQSVTSRGSVTTSSLALQGYVGIGTSVPLYPLHVKSGSDSQVLIETDSALGLGSGNIAGLKFKVEDTDVNNRIKGGMFFLNTDAADYGRGELILATNLVADDTNVTINDYRLKIGPNGDVYISGSLFVTGSVGGSIASSSFALTASYSTFSVSASYADFAASVEFDDILNKPTLISSSAQLADATIPGNLTVEGILTAQEFHTEFVSASIIYQSGSTKFGDTLDDKHEFTGSLEVLGGITGSLSFNSLTDTPTLLSSSAQIATEVSGAFTAPSASFSTRVTTLEEFSSSLDATFATDAELSALSASIVSGVVASSSYAFTASYYQETDTLDSVLARGNSSSKNFNLTSSLLPSGQFSSSFVLNTVTFNVYQNENVASGSSVIAVIPFDGGNAGHFEYLIRKSSNVRTGNFYFAWDGTNTPVHYDVSTIDIGTTYGVQLRADYSGSNCRVIADSQDGIWVVRGLLKLL